MMPELETNVVDLLVHSRERIAAPAATIWPHIASLAWMEAPKLVPIDGKPGKVGERFEAYHGGALAFHAVNVELTQGVRRTMRIESVDGVPMGFVSFELIPIGDDAIAMYDVALRAPLPDGTSEEDLLAGSRLGGDEALRQLKLLCERSPTIE